MLATHPNLTSDGMQAARGYNFERYRYQGIGRYEPAEAYARRGRCKNLRIHASAARALYPNAPEPKRLLARCGR